MSYKLLLSVIWIALACLPLQAETPCHCGLDPQSPPPVYVADNTPIYNSDLLLAKPASPISNHKKTPGAKKELPAPVENTNIEKETVPVVLSVFPFSPSPFAFLPGGRESAAISPQQRQGGQPSATKANRENIHLYTKNTDLSLYQPKQRQKLSAAATQCGMLTSFASTSPPPKNLSLRA